MNENASKVPVGDERWNERKPGLTITFGDRPETEILRPVLGDVGDFSDRFFDPRRHTFQIWWSQPGLATGKLGSCGTSGSQWGSPRLVPPQ